MLLETRALSKRFGGVVSLDAVDLVADRGEVHAVIGANGAGKSTFMNLLAGAFSPSAGEIRIDGASVRFDSPRAAREAGISIVYQELTVLPELTVAENVFLAREPRTALGWLDRRQLNRSTVQLLAGFDIALEPDRLAGELNIATQQLAELARALSVASRVLILDEPTAVLSPAERDGLFKIIAALKQKGLLILFVTHRLDEVFAIADRVTVLRNGKKVLTVPRAELDPSSLVRHMVGHDVASRTRSNELSNATPTVTLSYGGKANTGYILHLNRGQIVGLGGIVGSGRTRLARTLAGLNHTEVQFEIDGHVAAIRSPADAVRNGIIYLTEDRKHDGLFLGLPILHNTSSATLGKFSRFGVIDRSAERRAASSVLERLRLVARSLRAPVAELSGGNQQKTMFARALLCAPRVLICDEPTRGVDVGARDEIYETLGKLAADGVAIVLISSELKELLMLSHRILVMRDGRVVHELPAGATEHELMMAGAASDNSSSGSLRAGNGHGTATA